MSRAHESTLLAKLGFADPDRGNPLHDAACQYLAQEEKARKLAEMLLRDHMKPTARNFENPDGSASDYVSTWDFDNYRAEFEKHVCKGIGQYRSTIGFLDLDLTIYARCTKVGRVRKSDKITRGSGWAPATTADLEGDLSSRKFRCAATPGILRVASINGPDIHVRWMLEPMNAMPPPSPLKLKQLDCWHDYPTKERSEWTPYRSSIETASFPIHIEVKAHPATAGDVLRQIALYREFVEGGKWLLATCYPITRRDADALKNANIAHIQLDPETVQAWASTVNAAEYVAPTF